MEVECVEARNLLGARCEPALRETLSLLCIVSDQIGARSQTSERGKRNDLLRETVSLLCIVQSKPARRMERGTDFWIGVEESKCGMQSKLIVSLNKLADRSVESGDLIGRSGVTVSSSRMRPLLRSFTSCLKDGNGQNVTVVRSLCKFVRRQRPECYRCQNGAALS